MPVIDDNILSRRLITLTPGTVEPESNVAWILAGPRRVARRGLNLFFVSRDVWVAIETTMAMTVTPFESTDLADIYTEMLVGVPSIDTLAQVGYV